MTDDRMSASTYRKLYGEDTDGIMRNVLPRRRIQNRPEEDIQVSIIDYLRQVKLEQRGRCAVWHVPNEKGNLTRYEMVVRQRLGVRAGVADLILMLPDGRAAAVEVKASGNRQTEQQRDFEVTCRTFGWSYRVVRSLEAFEDELVRLGCLADDERILTERGAE